MNPCGDCEYLIECTDDEWHCAILTEEKGYDVILDCDGDEPVEHPDCPFSA